MVPLSFLLSIESDRYLKGHKIGKNKARDSSIGGDSGMSNMGMLAESHSKTIGNGVDDETSAPLSLPQKLIPRDLAA